MAAVHSGITEFSGSDHFLSVSPRPGRERPGVTASVTHVISREDGEQLFNRAAVAREGEQRNNFNTQQVNVVVRDMRQTQETFKLHRHGFELRNLVVPEDLDWSSQDEIESRYYPLAEEVIKQASGATRVFIFDNNVRKGKIKPEPNARPSNDLDGPVSRVHVDFTVKSGPACLHEKLPAEAETLQQTPFAVIQVWRPLKGPVNEAPLAIVDVTTVRTDSLMPVRLSLPARIGYTYTVKHDPGHKFWYAKAMTTSEALIFKCYDSRKGVARFTPHTSFLDPSTPPDAAPRQSIELRAYAFFQNHPKQAVQHEL